MSFKKLNKIKDWQNIIRKALSNRVAEDLHLRLKRRISISLSSSGKVRSRSKTITLMSISLQAPEHYRQTVRMNLVKKGVFQKDPPRSTMARNWVQRFLDSLAISQRLNLRRELNLAWGIWNLIEKALSHLLSIMRVLQLQEHPWRLETTAEATWTASLNSVNLLVHWQWVRRKMLLVASPKRIVNPTTIMSKISIGNNKRGIRLNHLRLIRTIFQEIQANIKQTGAPRSSAVLNPLVNSIAHPTTWSIVRRHPNTQWASKS